MKPITTLLALLIGWAANACTTFFINKNGQMVFGRNYDWVTGNGMVCVNNRGLYKTSEPTSDGNTISWVSRYGSITFNQYGKEFPMGGMNEKGLVVELMWLDGTKYPSPDDRPSMGVLQWIQYQLDNSATVDELVATDKKIRISSRGGAPLHYLVADAQGNAAAIEFLDGKMMIHRGKDLPFAVLTNSKYEESVLNTGIATASSGTGSVSFTDNSLERFAKACLQVRKFQQENIATPVIDYSFSILDNVAQGSHTKWSIVYDLKNMQIHFRTLGFRDIKMVSFSSFNMECSQESVSWNMNQKASGNVSGSFTKMTLERNKELVQNSCFESRTQIQVSDKEQKETWEYPFNIKCKD